MSTVIPRVRRDVFPALGAYIGGGMIAGVIVSVIIANVTGFGDGRQFVHGALSAGLGAILGLFVGLSRSVWHSGVPLRVLEPASVPHRLWDPWLDSGRDVQESRPELATAAADRDDPPTSS